MSQFTLFGQEISFLESYDRYYKVAQERRRVMDEAEKEFANFYQSKRDIRAVLEQYIEQVGAITARKALKPLYGRLAAIGIYDVSEKTFQKECWNLDEACDAYDKIVDQFNEIEEELELERAYREERKASRSRWSGGGFGLSGAVKGAATAGAMNMASGLGHSIANAIGNANSKRAADDAKSNLYNSNNTYNTLCRGVRNSIWDIYNEYMMLVNSYYEEDNLYFTNSGINEDKATALFENAVRISAKRKELLVEAFRLCPYYQKALCYAFEEYPEERDTICKMATFFAVDISNSYESNLAGIYSQTDKKDPKEMLAARAKIVEEMDRYGIKNSDTLIQLDKVYMQLMFDRHYKDAIPGERDEALEAIRKLNTSAQIKREFVQKNRIWELCKECQATFSQKEEYQLIREEYALLQKKQTDKEKKAAALNSMWAAFGYTWEQGFRSLEKKEEIFLLLCNKDKFDEPAIKAANAKKEKLLFYAISSIESGIDININNRHSYLLYRKGEAQEHIHEIEYITPEAGEYALLVYSSSLNAEKPFRNGFVLTDKRFVCAGIGSVNICVGSIPIFGGGGFLSDDITVTVKGYEHRIRLGDLQGKKHLVDCLQKAFKELNLQQEGIKEIDEELQENLKIKLALCVESDPFLVEYFNMQKRVNEINAQKDEVIKEQKRRQIAKIVTNVQKSNPNSVAEAWIQLHNGEYEPESYVDALSKLHQYFMERAERVDTLGQLSELESAQQKIQPYCAEDRMQAMQAAIDRRRERLIKEQKQKQINTLMNSVQSENPTSIAKVWVQLHQSEWEPELYAAEIDKMQGYLRTIAERAESLEQLAQVEQALNTILPYCNAERKQAIQSSVDGRREEAARIGEDKRQTKLSMEIMNLCDRSNLESILICWDKFLDSDCEKHYYDAYLEQLAEMIRGQVDAAQSIQETSAVRNQLVEKNAERYQNFIQQADEKIHKLDVAQRTYRGVVFASVEDIALAKEEERKLDIIMHTVAEDDIDSIENAIVQVSENPSDIKQVYLDKLNGYKATLGEQQRTYRGVTYETVEQAEQAKNIFAAMRGILDELNWNEESQVADAYAQISVMNHPITSETINQLKESLNLFDIQKRTVDGILFESIEQAELARTEYSFIQEKMVVLNEDDEPGMMSIRADISALQTAVKEKYVKIVEAKLEAYDIKARSFNGVVYETREIAEKHRQEAELINDIMSTVDANDEASMLSARDKLEMLTTFQKKNPILKITRLLEEYDIRVRTVAGVLYDTRQEAQLVSSELRRADEIMQTVQADDEASILNAQRAVLELTTFVKDVRYEELNQMWIAYDTKMRTYQDVVFATRKQAQSARAEHTEFLGLFNSLDLSQRKSVVTLNEFVEERIPDQLKAQTMTMIQNLCKVLDTVDYIIQRDREIDIATQKKESADLHKQIENVLPNMTYYRMNTDYMSQLKEKHYASLNVAKKIFNFFKSKR